MLADKLIGGGSVIGGMVIMTIQSYLCNILRQYAPTTK
jgi:hypothetical protein